MSDVITPSPGIYSGIPFDRYLLWDAVSNSRLGLLAKSPLHYQAGFSGETTSAMSLGSLVHCGVLEPEAVRQRYAVMPNFANDPSNYVEKRGGTRERSYSGATKWVMEQKRLWREQNAGREEVSRDHYDQLIGIGNSLCNNAMALDLFDSGEAEVSIIWDEDGLLCKARIDWFDLANMRFSDLKTCQDVLEFDWSIRKYQYGRQMAFYRRGIAALCDGLQCVPYLIACETTRPYACRVAACSESLLRHGDMQCTELLELLRRCKQDDYWPGPESPEAWMGGCADCLSPADVLSEAELAELDLDALVVS